MSTLFFKSKKEIDTAIGPSKERISSRLIATTAEQLQRKPEDVIVTYETWGDPFPTNAPAILIRAETSPKYREKLRPWGEALRSDLEEIRKEENLDPNLRLAVKPYILDSDWIE